MRSKMDSLLNRSTSLLWMFIWYFIFSTINISSDVALSFEFIRQSQTAEETTKKKTLFVFGLVVLAPVILNCCFNILKWIFYERYSMSCGSKSVPSQLLTWIFSPFYHTYLVFKILYKAMRGYASWKDDKLLLDDEVGNHEPGVEAIGQVVILGMVGFNALYSWILTTFFGRQLKTDIT